MQNGTRKSEGLPHLLRESATQSKRQHGRHKHRRLIAQVAVGRFRPEASELSAHAAAVCLTAITPLTASRLEWKRTGMHCGCNSVQKLPQTVGTALLRRGKRGPSTSMCWQTQLAPRQRLPIRKTLIRFSVFGSWRSRYSAGGHDLRWTCQQPERWKVLILDPLWRINVVVWFHRHTGDREWFGLDPRRKGLIVFRLRRLGSRFTTSLRESKETRHSWRYLKKEPTSACFA